MKKVYIPYSNEEEYHEACKKAESLGYEKWDNVSYPEGTDKVLCVKCGSYFPSGISSEQLLSE